MIPGPKPKAPEIAEKQGNPGHRPLVKTPESVPAADAQAPDWLKDTALAIWAAYMPRLRGMGYFKDTDRLAFARLCDHTARWLKLRVKVDEKGESYTTESRHGTMDRLNPNFVAMLRIEEKMVQLEDRFGLTPSARQQILARITDPSMLPSSLPDASGTKRPETSPIGMFAPHQGQPN